MAHDGRMANSAPSPVANVPVPALLTVREVADMLRTGKTTVYSYVRSGELESVHFGGSVRIPVDALREFVKAQAA
jgi:excisionase family DNA binding protein